MATAKPRADDRVELSAEQRQAKDEKQTVWVFVWTLFVFKIVTVGAIFWAAEGSGEAGALIAATTWPFLFVPAIAIAGPLIFYVRLRRIRARKKALLRSEWVLE